MIEQPQQHADKLGIHHVQDGALHESWGKPQIIVSLYCFYICSSVMHFILCSYDEPQNRRPTAINGTWCPDTHNSTDYDEAFLLRCDSQKEKIASYECDDIVGVQCSKSKKHSYDRYRYMHSQNDCIHVHFLQVNKC